MRKLFVVLPLAVLLLALTISWVSAGMDFEDPKLCVAGKWLVVDAAHPAGVQVYLPEGTRYGNAQQGGCKTPGPNAPLIQNVTLVGEHHWMRVRVDGAQASQPWVTTRYGVQSEARFNNGHGALNFIFFVQ